MATLAAASITAMNIAFATEVQLLTITSADPLGPGSSGDGQSSFGILAVNAALTVTGTTTSSIGLSWTEANNGDPAVSYKVSEGGVTVATSATTTCQV